MRGAVPVLRNAEVAAEALLIFGGAWSGHIITRGVSDDGRSGLISF